MVVAVGELWPSARYPAGEGVAARRVAVAQDPGADVEEVHVLLDVEVAAQPGEVVPVAHLPGHVGPTLLAAADPDAAAIVVGLQRDGVADFAVADAADAL